MRDLMSANRSKDDAIRAAYTDNYELGKKLEAAEARAAQLEAERDELARQLKQTQHENERLHAELVRVNQQNAQAVINSIRGEP
jgi:hypothetical protein